MSNQSQMILTEQCLDVLGLSYNHLTSDLKACLLYFGIFPEDRTISVKRLVRLWIAEGFLNLEEDFEGKAEKCLRELVDRCLVLVSKKNRDETKIRSCKVHDLIHDPCLREIQKGNVFLMNDIKFEESDAIEAQRNSRKGPNHVPSVIRSRGRRKMQPFKCWTGDKIRNFQYGLYRGLLIPGHHKSTDANNNNLLKQTRSIFFLGKSRYFFLQSELIHFKLLKVLDLSDIVIGGGFPLQILSLIWLRYLSLYRSGYVEIPLEICRLWNLQTFIVKGLGKVTFPEQIWELMQLRHLKMGSLVLPNCSSTSVDKGKKMGFSNIQTISSLLLHCCTKVKVILGIQNVKKLEILGDDVDDDESLWNNLVHLHQLESLSLKAIKLYSGIPSAKAFPPTLKKLKLEGTELSWSDLDIIAELPNLESLKLKGGACFGEEWDPNVRVLTRLKLLLIAGIDLKYWKATSDNFPVLERLFVSGCYHLKEIPTEFADIGSLQLIELQACTPGLEASVAEIRQEQEESGINTVDVRIFK